MHVCNGSISGKLKFTTYVRMSRDGPEAGLDELARILALLSEHRLLHVGCDLEDDAEDVHGPTDVVLQVSHLVSCRLFPHDDFNVPLPGHREEDFSSVR